MSSCFGFGFGFGRRRHDDERQPLLPRYNTDETQTARQARLREKLHTYQMLRALSKGYMPTTPQALTLLRTLLAADALHPAAMPQLSPAGRALVRSARLWLEQFTDLLRAKNAHDQIQDFIWCMARARVNIDAAAVGERAAAAKARADTAATVASLRSIGSLLLTNPEFRLFLSDLANLSRAVSQDTAFAVSDAARRAGKELDTTKRRQDGEGAPSKDDLERQVADVGGVVSRGAADVAQEAAQSAREHAKEDDTAALAKHLKRAVLRLRARPDYADSVATLSAILRRYMLAYSRAAEDALQAVQEDVEVSNLEINEAIANFWSLVKSLGDQEAWNRVEESFQELVEASQSDSDFEDLARRVSQLVQDMLMNPDFFDNPQERLQQVRDKAKGIASDSTVGDKLDDLVDKVKAALQSVGRDVEITRLLRTSDRIVHLLSPAGRYANQELLSDSLNVFLPVLVQAVQYLPIPRLEVATPSIDLLLENLVLEPGRTVNNSSFFPYKVHVTTKTDMDVRKARFRASTSFKSLLSIRLCGLSLAAEDLSYWLRLHSGLLRMMDQGIASFHLDERGIDIRLDVEIGRERLESMVTLRCVDVRIHHLNYKLSKSRFKWLAFLFKPLIRPLVTRALEYQIASAMADGVHVLNRELVFARERLRATRIAGPDDLWTFVKAVTARLVPRASPDVEARVGVRPGIFLGRYAPGSLVRLWEQEAEDAGQKIYEYERGGWRNEIFGVRTTPV